MRINEEIPFGSALALGLFDGVHLGHRAVIDRMLSYKSGKIKSCVFTFNIKTMLKKQGTELFYIYTEPQKLDIFRRLNVEYVYSADFEEFKNMPAEEFAYKIIKMKFHAGYVVCGDDFRFGRGGAFGVDELCCLGEKYGFKVDGVKKIMSGGVPISSCTIREYLRDGKIELANRLLGGNYYIEKTVIYGNRFGHKLNFPTINQRFDERQLILKFGVYMSRTYLNGKWRPSITNIGIKPTVGEDTIPVAETHILNFSGDLYGRVIKVELLSFIRNECKFSSLEELKENIKRDIETAERLRTEN